MPSLADLQSRFTRAVIKGDIHAVSAYLAGGADPRERLGIHRRHYETSLTAALRDKFPATAWLAGADMLTAAAREYVQLYPPRNPCIAEYGGSFPEFLAHHGRAAALPYLQSFAELERAVSDVSIAIDLPPLTWNEVANVGTERLLDLGVMLQPGVRYLHSPWGVDELMSLYLEGSEPETFVLREIDTFVEVRGARGALSLTRIDPATFAFRAALRSGRSIATAAEGALERDPTFDAGAALQRVTHLRLAARLSVAAKGVST